MNTGSIGAALNAVMAVSGGIVVFIMLLDALLYGATEGKGGPYPKLMFGCLAAIMTFVLAGAAKAVIAAYF